MHTHAYYNFYSICTFIGHSDILHDIVLQLTMSCNQKKKHTTHEEVDLKKHIKLD